MDPNTNQLLRSILEQVEENNKLLKKMHRSVIVGRVFRIIYWVVIIGVAFGSYYFIQPYIDGVLGAYSSLVSGVETINETAGQMPSNIGELLKNFGQ